MNTPPEICTTPTRTKQSTYQGFGPKLIRVWNGEHYQKATSSAHAQLIQNICQKYNKELAAQYEANATPPI